MDAEQVAEALIEHAERIDKEINRVFPHFEETHYLGDNLHLPHGHVGYLSGLFSLVDVLSICDLGSDWNGSQTKRMCAFLEAYVWPGRTEAQKVLIQMLRHTTMHTGTLGYVYDKDARKAYSWQWVGYGDDVNPYEAHAMVSDSALSMMTHLQGAAADAGVELESAGSLHISLYGLAADLVVGTRNYVEAMLADPAKRALAAREYTSLRMQRIR